MKYTKGAKLRAKKERQGIGMPSLAPAPRKEPNGRKQRETKDADGAERDASATVLKARARHMGQPSRKAKDMRDPRMSEQAGQAIAILCNGELGDRLWQHYKDMTSVEDRYHRSNGTSIHPKTAKIEMTPERFEARPDDAVDMRTEEERDEAAKKAWDVWSKRLDALSIGGKAAIATAKHGFSDLVQDGKATPAGERFVRAMVDLDAVVGER